MPASLAVFLCRWLVLLGLLMCWAAIALGEAVLQGGVPEPAACPGPEQTCHSPSHLVPERLGGEGTSNVICQGVNLVIWTSVTWHMCDTHRGSWSDEELSPLPPWRGWQ